MQILLLSTTSPITIVVTLKMIKECVGIFIDESHRRSSYSILGKMVMIEDL